MADVRQLSYFVAVAEELHFGRAAERLHISQPPLSYAIRQLEDSLGVLLLHRTTRRVWLTDAGAAFLDDARDVLARLEAAERRVVAVASGEEGRLRVGTITPALDGFLPTAVRRFRDRHPNIAVELAEQPTDAQLDALRADRLHVAIVRLVDHDLHGLDTRLVHRERFVAALPAGHPLERMKQVSLRRLAGGPLVSLPRHIQPTLHDQITQRFADVGVTPTIVQTAATVHGVMALVAAGIGAALVPASVAATGRSGVVHRPIRDALPRVEISAAWRLSDQSLALRRFLELLTRPAAAPATRRRRGP